MGYRNSEGIATKVEHAGSGRPPNRPGAERGADVEEGAEMPDGLSAVLM